MAARKKIGLQQVRALKSNEAIWDASVAGFGARRQRNAVSYVLLYRTQDNRQRFHTIGRHGAPWTPDTARKEAKRVLGQVVTGNDPAAEKRAKRKAKNVGDLCDAYLIDAKAGRLLTRRRRPKKASTLAIDTGRIERHIKPLIGKLKVAAVTRQDVDGLLHAVASGKTAATVRTKPRGVARVRGGTGTANRVVRLLGGIFSYAITKGLRTDNPVKGVTQFEDGQRERRLSDHEYKQLGVALQRATASDIWPAAVATAKFITLTGWRSGEVLSLRWGEVDLMRRTAVLGDTKTGRSVRPLPQAACEVLRKQPRTTERGLVFPASRGDDDVIMSGFKRFWKRIAKLGGIPPDVTPHVMRHTFASVAADLGYSDLTIGALIGHKGRSITSRYAHGADAVLLAAADTVAERIDSMMNGSKQAMVVELQSRRA